MDSPSDLIGRELRPLTSLRGLDRPTQMLLVALIFATAVTIVVLVMPSDQVGFESVWPWAPDCTYTGDPTRMGGAAEGCTEHSISHRQAVAVIIALNLVVAAPIALRGAMKRRVALASSVVVAMFALVTILRLGLLYIPSAVFLGLAAFGPRPDTSAGPTPESLADQV